MGEKSPKTFTHPSLEVHLKVQHNVTRMPSPKEAVLVDSSKKAKLDLKDKECAEESLESVD